MSLFFFFGAFCFCSSFFFLGGGRGEEGFYCNVLSVALKGGKERRVGIVVIDDNQLFSVRGVLFAPPFFLLCVLRRKGRYVWRFFFFLKTWL